MRGADHGGPGRPGSAVVPEQLRFPVQQSYLDNKGLGSFAPDLNQFPASDETSSCAYGIDGQDTAETVSVSVYQPFVVDSAVIDFHIEALEYKPDPSIASQGEYEVYSRSEVGDVGYLLRSPDATMVLDVGIPDAAEIGPKLVHAILDNIEELKAKPQGAYVPSYDSPTFTGTYPRACDLMDNDDVKVLTGLDSSPLVNELIPTATGILDLSDVDSAARSHAPDLSGAPEKSNYVRSSCTRRAVDPEYGVLARPSDHTITVTTTTYESPEAASAGLLYLAAGIDNESKQKGHGVGEEAFLYVDRDGQIVLAVRQGRVVAELLYDFAQQVDTPDAMAAKLSPLATKVATALAAY